MKQMGDSKKRRTRLPCPLIGSESPVIDVLDFRAVESDCPQLATAAAVCETWQVIPETDQGYCSSDTLDQAVVRRLLVCCQGNKSEEVRTYANYLGGLLRSQISYLDSPAKGGIKRISQEANDNDLVIFGEPKQSLLKRLLAGRPCPKAINQLPASLLVSWRPCWPVRTILLIARGEDTDEAAVEWVGRLARPSGAKVVILPILSSFPSVYAPVSFEETALGKLLSPTTESGKQLRCLSQRLVRWQIEGSLRFRQGEPEWQIRQEVTEGNYDLIVIGAEPRGRLQRLLLGELVNQMFGWLDRPLLVARPVQAAHSVVGDTGHD